MQSTPHPAHGPGVHSGTRLFAGLGLSLLALLAVELLTVPVVFETLVGFTVVFSLPILGPLVLIRVVRWRLTAGEQIREATDRESRRPSARPSFDMAD